MRLATPADAAPCLEIYRPIIEKTAISFETAIPSVAAFSERMARSLETHPWIVCELDGAVAGYAYAGFHRARAAYQWSAEVSLYVEANRRRLGLGRALYARLFDALRVQGFANAYAGITLPNPASVGFHEAMGFVPVGTFRRIGFKFGRWHDTGWWQLRLREDDAPAPPLPLRECRERVADTVRGSGG
jgi:phosphinothricin acetyltransferase